MKDSLDEMIKASCSNHAKLIEWGVPAEEALRIAFGSEFADSAIETVKYINQKPKQRGAEARN